MRPSRESTLLLAGMVIFSSLLLDQISTWAGLVLCETSTPPVPWKVIRQSAAAKREVRRTLYRVAHVQAAAVGGAVFVLAHAASLKLELQQMAIE